MANDYGIAVYGSGDIAARAARDPGFMDELFSEDMLGDDLEDWLAESALMKRTFRQCAVIAGPDRAPLSRREEDRAAGHDLDRSRL